jgi:hypothetical protein
MNTYTEGDLVHVRAYFSDPDTHDSVTPSTVTTIVVNPNGVETHPMPYVDSKGGLAIDIDTTGVTPGQWWYKWIGTGGHQAAGWSGFKVKPEPAPS